MNNANKQEPSLSMKARNRKKRKRKADKLLESKKRKVGECKKVQAQSNSAFIKDISFEQLGLDSRILKALTDEGYEHPTPVQAQSIPAFIDGRDVLGVSQTGSGKTAAFLLPVLQELSKKKKGRSVIQALVLSPTRELAAQIQERCGAYAKYLHFIKSTVVTGGVPEKRQIRACNQGVDILVATPGRLLDLCQRGFIDLSNVKYFVLDEADRMLDMGFVHDIKRVLQLMPTNRRNFMFSATFPPNISKLASSFLENAVRIDCSEKEIAVDRIQQKVMFVAKGDKTALLLHILQKENVLCGIVFTRTKALANKLSKTLLNNGISATAIHGNKSQGQRTKALREFKSGEKKIMVATDIASRGIDVDDITHVFNYNLPHESESYVHRIGRTARAGKSGISIAFCDDNEGPYLKSIQRYTQKTVTVDKEHPFHLEGVNLDYAKDPPHKKRGRQGGNKGGRNNWRRGRR